MADDPSQILSAARLQGNGEIVHLDTWAATAQLASSRNACPQVLDRDASPRIDLDPRHAVSLAGGAHNAAAAALTVEGGAITDVPPDSAGVRSFKGIPFAAPPIGELRWRAPQPVMPWLASGAPTSSGRNACRPGSLPRSIRSTRS